MSNQINFKIFLNLSTIRFDDYDLKATSPKEFCYRQLRKG
jgi:hypothetical protein